MASLWRATDDPRPDLQGDHHLWEGALRAAREVSADEGALYWTLDGLRCLGARLRPTPAGSLRLEPGEMDADEFRDDCDRYLRPHVARLRQVLQSAVREAQAALGD